MVMSAAWQCDRGCLAALRRTPPNISRVKLVSRPARGAVTTHGGFGYGKEFYVERYLREVMIPRVAPSAHIWRKLHRRRVPGLVKSY
jgi:acyl-CoA dehydrogenase